MQVKDNLIVNSTWVLFLQNLFFMRKFIILILKQGLFKYIYKVVIFNRRYCEI